MTPEEIAGFFTDAKGVYRFARWGRPQAPVVFGGTDETIAIFRAGLDAVAAHSRRALAETDPELGSNHMIFLMRDWPELADIPDLQHLVPELATLVPRLQEAAATRYRLFRFDTAGAIRAHFAFFRISDATPDGDVLALTHAVESALMWREHAFAAELPVTRTEHGGLVVAPGIAALLRAAYDPVMPDCAGDSAHALRLAARIDVV